MGSLPVKVAKEAIFPTAEGEEGHGRGGGASADIDANVARSSFVAKLAGGGPAAGKQAGHVAPGTLVHQLNGVVDGVDLHQPQDGTKKFPYGRFRR